MLSQHPRVKGHIHKSSTQKAWNLNMVLKSSLCSTGQIWSTDGFVTAHKTTVFTFLFCPQDNYNKVVRKKQTKKCDRDHTWPIKPKIFITWFFQKKFSNPLLYSIPQ